MRIALTTIAFVALTGLAVGPAFADELTAAQLRAAAKAAGSANGLCPVLNRIVTVSGGSSTYAGEKIGFCCPDCRAKFDADPTRYMDRMRVNPPKYHFVSKAPSLAAMRKAKQATASANGRCPVMGRVVTPTGGFATYRGQRIQFCCSPCKDKFRKQPEKYMRLMRADPLAYAYDRPGPTNTQMRVARTNAGTVNGRCPVMGRLVVVKGGSVTYRGEKIGFCCPPCIEKFKADPEKYMAFLRSEPAVYGYVPTKR